MSGRELWKTDGTDAGTVRIADINPGSASSGPDRLLAWNGMVIFTATSAGQPGLWRTDGTAAGTMLVKAVTPARDITFVPWGNGLCQRPSMNHQHAHVVQFSISGDGSGSGAQIAMRPGHRSPDGITQIT